jgi:hypothetical protein
MVDREDAAKLEAQIQAVVDELGVSWEAAAVLVAVRNGDALVGDIVFESSTDGEVRQPVMAATGTASGTGGTRVRHAKGGNPPA